MKDSFVLFTKIKEVIGELSDAQKGMLFQAILDYETDIEPCLDDPSVKIAFIPIRQDLDYNDRKWENTQQARSRAGKMGAEAKRSKAKQSQAKASNANFDEAKEAVYVNESVNEYVNEPLQGYFPDEELNLAFNQYVDKCRHGDIDFMATQKYLYDLAQGDKGTMIAILNQSVAQGWTGLFPIKKEQKVDKVHFENERTYDFKELEQKLVNKNRRSKSG